MYKIIVWIIIFSLLSNNVTLAINTNNNVDITNNNIKSIWISQDNDFYNEREKWLIEWLMKEQTAKEAEIELKLFKLQKSLISNIENKYNELNSNYKSDLETLKNLYLQSYKTESDLNINIEWKSNSITPLFIPNIKNDTSLFWIKTDIKSIFENSKDTNKSSFNWNVELTILNNWLNSKFDIQDYYNNWKLILNLNKLNFKTNFQYDNSLKIINPNLTEDEFKKFTTEIDSYLNKINKNSLFLKWKAIEISAYDQQILNQWQMNFDMLYKAMNEFTPDQINKIFNVLKSDHVILVYKTIWNNKYSILYNNDISIKINNIIGKQLLPIIKYSDIKKLEWDKANIIEELNNGNFKYQKIKKETITKDDKKVKEITEALYFEFNSDKIHTFLLKDANQTLFFTKNILQIKTNELLWYFMFNSKDLMWKVSIKEKTGDLIEIMYYLKEKFQAWIIDLKIKDRLDKSIIWKWNIKYIKLPDTKEYKINFNTDISWKIIKSENSQLNKNWAFKLNWEYIFSKTNIKSNIDIIQTDIFPVSITWKINANVNYTKLDDNNSIVLPTITKKYQNINEFLNNELLK